MRTRFRLGNEVEGIGREAGFIGSFYQAKIISNIDDEGRYEVEYLTLIEDEETRIPLKEKLFPQDMRPKPPCVRNRGFRLSQCVDAFHNDGWWTGTITRKVENEGLYYVYFRSTGETIGFHGSSIRVHQEFIDGRWCITNNQ